LTGTEEHNLTSTGMHPNNSRCLNINIEFKEKMLIREPKEPDKESRHAQKGTQIMGPVTIDTWMLDNGRTNPEVREARQRRSDEVSIGHQTAVPPYRESRQRQRDTLYGRQSFTNNKHMRWVEDPPGMDEEQGTGDVPAIRQTMQSGRHKRAFKGHQTDMASFQVQPAVRSNAPGDGETRRCHGDAVYDKQSYTNMVSGVNDDKLRRLSEKAVNK
jgi:hypothetical protein